MLLGLEYRVADRIALPAVDAEFLDGVIHVVHPAFRLRLDNAVRQHPPRTGNGIDGFASGRNLVVGQEEIGFVIDRRARQNDDIGIAVDEDFLDVVGELQPIQFDFALHAGIPVCFGELRDGGNVGRVIVPHEMRLAIEDELLRQACGPRIRHPGIRCFRLCNVVKRTEDLVHRNECGGHAR